MKTGWLAVIVLLFSVCALQAQAQDSTCHLFLLKKAGSDLALERVPLANGEVKVFPVKVEAPNIALILAIAGPGRSGDLVRLGDNHSLIAQCTQGELHIKFRRADGAEREWPARKMATLAQYDLRVNVTGKNLKKVFRVLHYDQVEVDESGPVIDMFGGKVPVSENDYLLTVETHERAAVKSALKG